MCGIVDIRNKRGGGHALIKACLVQVGSKLGLETVQGLGCHYFLGQAVPFGDGPGEV